MAVVRKLGLVITAIETIVWLVVLVRACTIAYPNTPVVVIITASLVLIVNLWLLISLAANVKLEVHYHIALWLVWSAVILSVYITFGFLLAFSSQHGQESISRFFGIEINAAYIFICLFINVFTHSVFVICILHYGKSMDNKTWTIGSSTDEFLNYI